MFTYHRNKGLTQAFCLEHYSELQCLNSSNKSKLCNYLCNQMQLVEDINLSRLYMSWHIHLSYIVIKGILNI